MLGEKEVEAAAQAIRGGFLQGNGPNCQNIEQEVARHFGIQHALLMSSCTHALEASLMAIGVGYGDEVICPSFAFTSTATAIVQQKARPVFVDIESDTCNMDVACVKDALSARTKAIIPVHYAGHACDMEALSEIGNENGIKIIEDAAHAFDAQYRGQYLGCLGIAGCFSFHETKQIICGEGGLLVTNDMEVANAVEMIRDKGTNRKAFLRGEVDKYSWVSVGSSYVLSDVLAAILRVQLSKRTAIIAAHKWLASQYTSGLSDLQDQLELPVVRDYANPNWSIFAVKTRDPEQRDALIRHLKDNSIQSAFHYVPLHSSPFGRSLGYMPGDLPVTERVFASLVRLPMSPRTEEDVERVINCTHDFFGNTSPGRQVVDV